MFPLDELTRNTSLFGLIVFPLPSLCSLVSVILVFGPGRAWFSGTRLAPET